MPTEPKLDKHRVTFLPRTLIGQLVLFTIGVQVIVLAVFMFLSVRSQMRLQLERDTARVKMQAELFAREAADEARNEDVVELDHTSEAMRSSAAVLTARVFDPTGRLLAVNDIGSKTVDAAEAEAIHLTAADGKYYHLPATRTRGQEGFAPIMDSGKVIAVTSIISDPEVGPRGLKVLIRSALLYSLFALVANILLIMLIGRTITRPLERLNAATKQVVRDSDSTTGFPLPVPARNETGELTHSFNVMVRELRQQRNGLADTLALLDSMLENAPVGFAFFDRRHKFVRANLLLERMYDQQMHKHFGRTLRELYPGKTSDELEHLIEQVFVTGEEVRDRQIAGALQTETGEQRTWICSFYPVKPDEQHVRWVGMVMTEVTNRVREEEAMRRSEKLAAAGRLAASIAHEINNPLESVTNLLYLIRTNPSLNEDAVTFAEMAQRELARVSEITQQTLRFYRSSSRAEDVAVGDVIESVLTLHAARLQAANIRIEREIDASAVIFGFSGELRQVFANLIGNAADAMPRGGVLRIRVARRRAGGTDGIAVMVADTGTGMAADTRSHIFEPFYTTKEATGTGLGLWVSEEIVAKHSGSIRVRSRQGASSGTVFRIFLPLRGQ